MINEYIIIISIVDIKIFNIKILQKKYSKKSEAYYNHVQLNGENIEIGNGKIEYIILDERNIKILILNVGKTKWAKKETGQKAWSVFFISPKWASCSENCLPDNRNRTFASLFSAPLKAFSSFFSVQVIV